MTKSPSEQFCTLRNIDHIYFSRQTGHAPLQPTTDEMDEALTRRSRDG
jgi:hypothetical protein